MKLSIIIPIYNEERNIEHVFERLSKVQFPCDIEYLAIEDGSKDKSWEVLQKVASSYPNLVTFRQPINMGKGAAIHKGIELATGHIVAVQDADFEVDPEDLPKLVQPILDRTADAVFGSRFHKGGHHVHHTYHYMANRILTLLSNFMSNIHLSDMETCYKVVRRDIIANLGLESKRFGFEPEVTAKLAKLNITIQEYPIAYHPRTRKQGKKIGWKDGFAAIWFIMKYNLTPLSQDITKKIPLACLT